MPITFIPFSAFQPDGGDYGPGLSVASNVLPIHGGWRALQGIQRLCSVADDSCLGAYTHVYQQAQALEFLRPKIDVPGSTWRSKTGAADDLYTFIDEESPSESDYIVAGNAPNSQAFYVNVVDPLGGGAAVNYYIRFRYRIPVTTGAWTLDFKLLEGLATTRATLTASGASAVPDWTTAEYALSGPEIASIGNLNNLIFKFIATVPGSAQYARPTADSSIGGWLTNGGSGSALYATIDETSASDTDYAKSKALAVGGSSDSYVATFGAIASVQPWTGYTWRYRYRGANAGAKLVARLKHGSTLIAENTHASAGTTFATQSSGFVVDETIDLAALSMEFEASFPAEATSTVFQYARPDGDDSYTGTLPMSTEATLYEAVDEASASDADYFYGSVMQPGFDVYLSLSDVSDPLCSGDHILRARLGKLSTAAASCNVYLYQGSSLIAALPSATLSTLPTTYSYTLTAAEANSITDYTDLFLRVVTAEPDVACYWLEFAVPEVRRIEVSWAEVQGPSESRAEVSWAEMQIPDSVTTYRGDIPTTFVGSKTKLYEASRLVVTDISKGGGYSGGAINPGSWSFCSWGNDVIATNYIDPVQYRAGNTGAFADLITSTDKPKARFCAPFRNQLMLAGINLSGHYDDEIWISAVDNARSFGRDRQTQTDYQRIVSCPGQITGLVGGDFALVFKRRSIHAIEWTGGATVFRVRDLTSSIGTPYSRSIVSCDSKVYFWGGDSFYVTDGVSMPERIGADVVGWYLTDAAFSGGALARSMPASIADEDQVLIGSYDPAAGLIVWSYQKVGQSSWAHNDCLFYNPREDRWSVGSGYSGTLPLASLCQMPNVSNNDTHVLRGTVLFGVKDGSLYRGEFSDTSTLSATLTTRRQTLGLEDSERPTSIQVTGILPVWTTKLGAGGSWPSMSITATAAHDQRMVLGVHSETYTSADADEAQWFPFVVNGSWWQFSVAIPQYTLAATTAFQGIYVRWQEVGRAG